MVSFCVIRLEIEESSPIPEEFDFNCGRSIEDLFSSMSLTNPVAADAAAKAKIDGRTIRGNRAPSEVVVETIVDFSSAAAAAPTAGKSGKSSKESTPGLVPGSVSTGGSGKRSTKDSTPAGDIGNYSSQIGFTSGNPFVEVTRGVLHLYKENEITSLEDGVIRTQMLCMLGVPAKHKTPDLLQFTAPCHEDLEMMRIIQDGSPNQFMVLLRFRCQDAADEFYKAYNGLPFNSLEPETCNLVYVSKVEACKETEYYPLKDHTELPVCSICLERMDESISTVLTILCNHSFHGQCLAQWEDTTCPVCRYMQSPEIVAEQRCSECLSSEDLWICLICGYVGCGRYVGGHSHAHFLDTSHSYTMELGQNRVWDYVGDNFVHRLVQTDSADGKLVEAEGGGDGSRCCSCSKAASGAKEDPDCPMNVDEKIDSIQLEYTYLLTSQLESQRRFFEEKITRLEEDSNQNLDEIMNRVKLSSEENSQLKSKVENLTKEKVRWDRKITEINAKLIKANNDLKEERQMNESLRQNQREWQIKLQVNEKRLEKIEKDREEQVRDLQEQLRDMMFFLEAKDTIANSEIGKELQEGDIVVPEAKPTGAKSKRRSKNR